MVEHSLQLNLIFQSLADATRRDILIRVAKEDQPIKTLARHYSLTFAGIAKHISILEKAHLIKKQKRGREQIISSNPKTINMSKKYIEKYQTLLSSRYEQLDQLLNKM